MIEKEIEKLTVDIATIEKQLKPIKKDCSLNSIDHKMLKQQQNINIQRYEIAKIRLNKLKVAYLQIDTNEYDICKEYKDDINIKQT